MAVFADVAGLNMRLGLAGCLGTVMAAEAIARDVDVIEVRGQPAGRRMTVVAVVATSDMRRVLTCSRQAVMTGAAAADDLGVVHRIHRRPYVAVMAVFANVCRLHVRQGLTGGFDAVVAAETVSDYAGVVKIGRPPGTARMAVITGIAAVDMCGVLAGGRDTVVTRAAGANHLRVVDRERGREHVGIVAVLAYVCGLNVCLVLAG